MEIYILRHGVAEEPQTGQPDAERALQTAQLAAEILEYKGELLRTKALEPGSSPKTVWDEIRVHKDEAQILLAGHEPLFSRLTAHLLGAPNLQVDFKKGAIVCIEF